jgi:hypothetical protein
VGGKGKYVESYQEQGIEEFGRYPCDGGSVQTATLPKSDQLQQNWNKSWVS